MLFLVCNKVHCAKYFLYSILYNMENVILSRSERVISDCHSFKKKDWSWTCFSIDYIVNRKVGDERKKEPQFKIFDRSTLPASFDKKTDSEICQELKWKSLVIEQKISI